MYIILVDLILVFLRRKHWRVKTKVQPVKSLQVTVGDRKPACL